MELKFFSIDEVKEFVKQLKGTRGGKGGDAEDAPAPVQPPAGGFNPSGFAPPGAGAGQVGAGPFAAGAPAVAPEVLAIVSRINAKVDGAIAGGQPADSVLAWFRSQCGAEAANATLDQIKTVFLAKTPMPTLENIAKLMNA